MRIIEIKEDSLRTLAESIEKMLRYGGKAMQCVESMRGEEMMGEHRNYDRGREYDREDDREMGGRYGGEMYGDRRRRYY